MIRIIDHSLIVHPTLLCGQFYTATILAFWTAGGTSEDFPKKSLKTFAGFWKMLIRDAQEKPVDCTPDSTFRRLLGAGDGIRTHEHLRDWTLNPAPLTWLGNPRKRGSQSHAVVVFNSIREGRGAPARESLHTTHPQPVIFSFLAVLDGLAYYWQRCEVSCISEPMRPPYAAAASASILHERALLACAFCGSRSCAQVATARNSNAYSCAGSPLPRM